MMQHRCVCGYYMGQCPNCQREGRLPYSGAWIEVPGRPVSLKPQEIPPQFGGYQPVSREDDPLWQSIAAYARKLLAERAAIVKSERITRTVHEMIKAAGGEPRL